MEQSETIKQYRLRMAARGDETMPQEEALETGLEAAAIEPMVAAELGDAAINLASQRRYIFARHDIISRK